MDRSRAVQGIGVLAFLASIPLIWLSSEFELCPPLHDTGQCYPNPFTGVPGLLLAFIGIALVVGMHNRNYSDNLDGD